MKQVYFLLVLFIVDVWSAKEIMLITVHCPADPKLRQHILAKADGENFIVQCSESSKISLLTTDYFGHTWLHRANENMMKLPQELLFAPHTGRRVLRPTSHAPFILSALRLIEFRGRGQAKSSSRYNEDRSAEEAFNGKIGRTWASSSTDPTPKIWFQFEEAHSLAKIGFSSRSGGVFGRTPAHFLVIGSTMTEDCTNWSTLLEVKNAGFAKKGEFKSWLIPPLNRKPFHCIGFQIVSTIKKKSQAVLTNITMWE